MATKARAYAAQARADYDAYEASGRSVDATLGEHHRLQLLQMEKVAKAFLYHAEPNARYPHHVALSALNRLRSHAIAQATGLKFVVFNRMLDAAKPIFLQIEAASPSVGLDGSSLTREESERTVNVEYPWQSDVNDPASWIAPVSHTFPIMHQLRYDPRSYHAVRLLSQLIKAANQGGKRCSSEFVKTLPVGVEMIGVSSCPEQSTSTLITHHPQAKYFNVE